MSCGTASMLVEYIEAELAKHNTHACVMEELYRACGENDIAKWVQDLKRPGHWAGTTAAVFLGFSSISTYAS